MTGVAGSSLAALRDGLRTRLWPIPVTAVVAAVAGGLVLPLADLSVDSRLSGWADSVVFGGDANAARTVLDAVASSLVTVTSLTFSLTVVTLQLASSQYSPRLLRTFTQDLFVQTTLGLFVGTFAFALTVLRSVRSEGSAGPAFVPRLSVSAAFLLALASVVALVLFLAHLARQIRVETVLDQVRRDAVRTVDSQLPVRSSRPTVRVPARGGPTLVAPSSGFLESVDVDDLLEASGAAGATVVVGTGVGEFVVEGTPVGHLVPLGGTPLSPETLAAAQDHVATAMTIGLERTARQDIGFGLRQLTDVATKALSPGVNDPTTAVHAIGHLSALLCHIAGRELGPAEFTRAPTARVVVYRPHLDDLLEACLTQLRRYGSTDPVVAARLYGLLADLAVHVRGSDSAVVARERERLDDSVLGADFDQVTRRRLSTLAQVVTDRCGPPPSQP